MRTSVSLLPMRRSLAWRAAAGAGLCLLPALSAHAQAVVPLAAASQASSPLMFRREPEAPAFPTAGLVFMLFLMGIAAFGWWLRKRRGGAAAGARPWVFGGLASNKSPDLKLVSSLRLDAGTRLHVVEWKNRQVLLAVQGTHAPVVLDRIELADATEGSTP